MYSGVKVKTKENQDLVKKLRKHRRIAMLNDSKLMKLASPVRKFFSILLMLITIGILIFVGLFVYSLLIAKRNGVVPRFAGLSLEKVATGSMIDSGLDKGKNLIVYKVDPHTLHVGDIIAFYVYAGDGVNYRAGRTKPAVESTTEHAKYDVTIDDFLGKINPEFVNAARTNSKLVIHHIVSIREDKTTGKWWFETKGSSNPVKDSWHISEDYIVGYYHPTLLSEAMGNILNFLTTFTGIMIIVGVPLAFLALLIISAVYNHVQLNLLEEEVINGDRPVSDPVCVKHKIGRNLSNEDKFIVLANAKEEERADLLPFLYEDGAVPNALYKYYHRKKLMMMPIYELNKLQQKAQEQYNNGVSMVKVMKEYERGKEELLSKHESYRLMFKEQDKVKHPLELIALRKSKKAKRLVDENDVPLRAVVPKKEAKSRKAKADTVTKDSKGKKAEIKSKSQKASTETKTNKNITKKKN